MEDVVLYSSCRKRVLLTLGVAVKQYVNLIVGWNIVKLEKGDILPTVVFNKRAISY